MAEALTTTQVKPSALGSPVPGQQEEEDLISQFLSAAPDASGLTAEGEAGEVGFTDAPEEPAAAGALGVVSTGPAEAAAAEVPEEDLISSLLGEGPEELAPEPSFLEANITPAGIREQLDTALTEARVMVSFGTTKKEKKQALEKALPGAEVKEQDGELVYKRKGQKQFRKLDRDTIELIGDVLDGSRGIIEELLTVPTEVAGFFTAGPAGVVGGRAVGAGAAVIAADEIAEAMGIERDPERSRALEVTIASTLNAVLPVVTKGAASLTKRVALGKKAAIPEHELLSEASKEFEQAAGELAESGLIQNVPGTNTKYALHQLHPDNPQATKMSKSISDTPTFRKFIKEQGEAIGAQVNRLLEAVGNMGGKKSVTTKSLSETVTNIAQEARRAEGASIGKFRMQATQKIGANTRLRVAPEVNQAIQKLSDHVGFTTGKQGELVAPSVDEVLFNTGLTAPGAARVLINKMQRLHSASRRGLTLENFQKTVTDLDKASGQISKSGGDLKRFYLTTLSQLRKNRNSHIRSGLPESSVEAFDQSSTKFINILNAQNTLANSLGEDMSRHAFMKSIFTAGRAGLPNLKAAKTLLSKEHPDVYRDLVGDWVDDMVLRHTKSGPTGLNSNGMLKELRKFGSDYLDEVFEGTGSKPKDLFNLLTFGKRLEETNFSALSRNVQEELIRQGAQTLSGFKSARIKAVLGFLRISKGKNTEILEVMSSEGIDKFLDRVPKAERPRMRKLLQGTIEWARMNKVIPSAARGAGRGALRREAVERTAFEGEGEPL